jgi:hypothetical protein
LKIFKINKLAAINLIGGLGNQMFQYSIGIILQLENKINVKFDVDFFKIKQDIDGFKLRNLDLDVFDVQLDELTKEERNYFLGSGKLITLKRFFRGQPFIFYESESGYKNDWSKVIHNTYYFGYFQKFEFYKGYEKILMKSFQFNTNKISQKALEFANCFVEENSVSIHIRKGDYVNDKQTKSIFFNLDIEYYNNAIDHLSKLYMNLKFYVFSDDINWVVKNFNPKDIIFEIVELNNKEKAWEDMFLMTKCKHNIIANSTFSWWGAFLNPNPKKVIIAPKNWYNDSIKNQNAMEIYPTGWILI